MHRKQQKFKHCISVFTGLSAPVGQAHSTSASTAPAGRSVRAAEECSQGGRHLSGKDIHQAFLAEDIGKKDKLP